MAEEKKNYEPISMWGYFGYEILFAIPVIGLIALLISAFGSKNVNVRNFAKSKFCAAIILGIIVVIVVSVVGVQSFIDALEQLK